MQRFFVQREELEGDEVVMRRQAHQIRNVLRLKTGEHIILLDNEGWAYEMNLTKVSRNEVKGEIVEKREAKGEPSVKITLYQGMSAREKFEWVLQKCTEIGVARFVPMITERSIVRDCEIKQSKMERWRRIIEEAAEQSHRGRIPELSPPTTFEKALDGIDSYGWKLIATPASEGSSLRDCLKGCTCGRAKGGGGIGVFVGPEGGLTEEEVRRSVERGARAFSLGERILRTETAAVVASAVILYELGQLEG